MAAMRLGGFLMGALYLSRMQYRVRRYGSLSWKKSPTTFWPGWLRSLSRGESGSSHVAVILGYVEDATTSTCRMSLQLVAKTGVLVDQLKRIGKLTNIPIEPIVPSPEVWNYRNYVQFHFSHEGRLGYNRARSNEIIPVEECFLPQKPLDELWPMVSIEPGTEIRRNWF